MVSSTEKPVPEDHQDHNEVIILALLDMSLTLDYGQCHVCFENRISENESDYQVVISRDSVHPI